jgi:hypothetical protein
MNIQVEIHFEECEDAVVQRLEEVSGIRRKVEEFHEIFLQKHTRSVDILVDLEVVQEQNGEL